MVFDRKYNSKGELISERTFNTVSDASAFYNSLKDPDAEESPADGCWNCMNFDWKHEACTLNWNNLDESYYNHETDNRELTDYCGEWEEDPDADPECLEFGGNEP
jgi:hypothetical protein